MSLVKAQQTIVQEKLINEGFGTWPFTRWLAAVTAAVNAVCNGETVTITTAALTSGGTQGSLTFTNGVLTAHTDAT